MKNEIKSKTETHSGQLYRVLIDPEDGKKYRMTNSKTPKFVQQASIEFQLHWLRSNSKQKSIKRGSKKYRRRRSLKNYKTKL